MQPPPPPPFAPARGGNGFHGTAPFSVHSRGVQLVDVGHMTDVGYQFVSFATVLRDMGSSFWVFVLMQNWNTIASALITVGSVSFFSYAHSSENASLDWSVIGFSVLLPLLLLLLWGYRRREEALAHLAEVRALLLQLALVHRDWGQPGAMPPQHTAAVHHLLFGLMDAFRTYFLQPRFYTSTYPYTSVQLKMMQLAQERAHQLRRITAILKSLSGAAEGLHQAGLDGSQLAQLSQYHLQLCTAFERLANIKEFRLPQGVRALARCYVLIFIPVFSGPYWIAFRLATHSFTFALFYSVFFNVALTALLNVALALEDPFDNEGLDGVYVDEAFFEVEQAMSMDEDAELAAMATEAALQAGEQEQRAKSRAASASPSAYVTPGSRPMAKEVSFNQSSENPLSTPEISDSRV